MAINPNLLPAYLSVKSNPHSQTNLQPIKAQKAALKKSEPLLNTAKRYN
jgi:hypothetical protein